MTPMVQMATMSVALLALSHRRLFWIVLEDSSHTVASVLGCRSVDRPLHLVHLMSASEIGVGRISYPTGMVKKQNCLRNDAAVQSYHNHRVNEIRGSGSDSGTLEVM
ncbi:hypothetical protein DFH94DRAFT_140402 [Russula ochroleuca]|uniref:Secreted protein n=1 Tax=Russula ochroleuca TaxID=152965 RepID=A0A9P5MQI3_9AGAM|nr:hypothetical protein DFH94DRAFT_140402 [Russula ochroleuca]